MLKQQIKEFDIPVVDIFQPFSDIKYLIEHTRNLKNAEGFVVSFRDGHKVKIKADEYVRIHKTMDLIKFDRNIVDLIVNENIDDVVGMLPPEEAIKVKDFEKRFWKSFNDTEKMLYDIYREAGSMYNYDKKMIALEYIPMYLKNNKSIAQFLFGQLDGKNLRELLLTYIKKHLTSNTKWEECAKFLKLE